MVNKELRSRYKPLQLLHHGIGGEVWMAEHIGLSARRVLKIIERSHPQCNTLVQEAYLLQQCRHPSIPIIYDILEFDTQIYIVEEFIEGETLKQYIQRQQRLSDSFLLIFSMQLCEILQFLHNPARPILHLDLKPENILISDHKMKLIDFGSAICKNRQEEARFIFGTPAYCAPEMKRGGILSEKTDLYGLGRCMEYMMKYAQDVPREYQNVVDRCLRRRGAGYTSAEQVLEDLKKIDKRGKRKTTKEVWFAVTGVLSEHESAMVAQKLAAYLKHKYKKQVLYLDCSVGRQTEALEQKGQEFQKEKRDGFVFEREGITIAKRIAPQEVTGWRHRGYTYVICDFGNRSPLLSDCVFSACFYVGALTELVEKQWEETLLPVYRLQKTVILMTGGDKALAKSHFRSHCIIRSVSCFGAAFQADRSFGRMMKRLLKQL